MNTHRLNIIAEKLFNKFQGAGHTVLNEWENKEEEDLLGIYSPYHKGDLSTYAPDFIVIKEEGNSYGYMIGYTSSGGYDEQPLFDYTDCWKDKDGKPFRTALQALVALVKAVVMEDISLTAHTEEEIAMIEEEELNSR